MGRTMKRGKQQIMYRFLPGKTFDFERAATIARVSRIRGDQQTELNIEVILRKIEEEVRVWKEDFRPTLKNEVLRNAKQFVLLEPSEVEAELFPKVFWCQNR